MTLEQNRVASQRGHATGARATALEPAPAGGAAEARRWLPCFCLEHDGERVACEADAIRSLDGVARPGVTIEWRPCRGASLRFQLADGAPGIRFGRLLREAPLALRHAVVARRALEAITRLIHAATQAPAASGEGPTKAHIGRVLELLAQIDEELAALEALAARAPQALLAGEVYASITAGEAVGAAEARRAVDALDAALARVDARAALAASERLMLREELALVRRMAAGRAAGSSFGPGDLPELPS